ncbi:MAG TPA: RHS repeat-associated core domain-containing protein, partial [Solirubrobacteraceae bacterium]
GNLETFTDPRGHAVTYVYSADNQPTQVKRPDGAVLETAYDGSGRVTSQTDGDKHTVKYVRNVLGEITEIVDPLGRTTKKEYDAAGNLTSLTDPLKRTTKYAYDADNRLLEVVYSDGKTPTLKYEYDADGNRTKMIDGTGETKDAYDQLDRLTQNTNGNGESVSYAYDLANEQTKLTYPGGQRLTRAYDTAGRLQTVTDSSEHQTKFSYDPDSNLATIGYPKSTGVQDKLTYDNAGQQTKLTIAGGAKTLASLTYVRDADGQVESSTATGLPGSQSVTYAYDADNRLTKAGATAYEYDAADNPIKIGSGKFEYDAANQLKTGAGVSYAYDEAGERTSATPKAGPATTYAYDQSGHLLSVSRTAEGKIPAIKDLYTYDGDGLRASQLKQTLTNHLAWSESGRIPTILGDEQNSYIYGPGGIAIEQVPAKGNPLYLHQDQQGSIRALTSATGAVEATMTYDAYGNPAGTTGAATTPLGYDGEYTNAATGLVYLRARSYDPGTAQFMTSDPLGGVSRSPYGYTYDNPLNLTDPSGRLPLVEVLYGKSPISHALGQIGEGIEEAISEHPAVISVVGCTTGALLGPGDAEICTGAIAASYGTSTTNNIGAYANGELDAEQLITRQLFTATLAIVGAAPGISLLGTPAGELVDQAPPYIRLLIGSALEGTDATLGALEAQLACAAGVA